MAVGWLPIDDVAGETPGRKKGPEDVVCPRLSGILRSLRARLAGPVPFVFAGGEPGVDEAVAQAEPVIRLGFAQPQAVAQGLARGSGCEGGDGAGDLGEDVAGADGPDAGSAREDRQQVEVGQGAVAGGEG